MRLVLIMSTTHHWTNGRQNCSPLLLTRFNCFVGKRLIFPFNLAHWAYEKHQEFATAVLEFFIRIVWWYMRVSYGCPARFYARPHWSTFAFITNCLASVIRMLGIFPGANHVLHINTMTDVLHVSLQVNRIKTRNKDRENTRAEARIYMAPNNGGAHTSNQLRKRVFSWHISTLTVWSVHRIPISYIHYLATPFCISKFMNWVPELELMEAKLIFFRGWIFIYCILFTPSLQPSARNVKVGIHSNMNLLHFCTFPKSTGEYQHKKEPKQDL